MKLSPENIKLWEDIHKVLWEDWDPIGINNCDGWPNDEYNGYIPKIYKLKAEGASKLEIAEELHRYETLNMGLSGDKNHCLKIAEKIINL